MPVFSFKAKNAEGKVVSGQLETSSLVNLRRLLAQKELELLDVEDCGPDINYRLAPSSTFRGLSFAPPDQTEYRPTLSERVVSVFTNDSCLRSLIGGLALVGTLLFFLSWKSRSTPNPVSTPTATKPKVLSLAIQGELGLPPLQPEEVTVVLDIPEVPFRHQVAYRDARQADGSYRIELEFETARSPSYGNVFLSRKGKVISDTARVQLGPETSSKSIDLKVKSNL